MQVYKAIKYIRLSYTDDKTVESDSVANQRRLTAAGEALTAPDQ